MSGTSPAFNAPIDGSREDITYIVATVTLFVATVAVCLRVYTRKVLINQLGIDDFCACFALLIVFGCDFAVAWNTRYGLGQHIWNVPKESIPLYMRTFYVSIALYNASLMFIKMTFLLQYYRIFAHSSKRFRHIFIGVAVVVMLWAISQLLIAILTCDPIEGYWDPIKMKTAVCIGEHPFWEINAAGNIATDVLIFTLPIPVIEQLKLPRRQKAILFAIFILGFFTVCISLVRIRFLKQYEDFTWENVETSGWSMGEIASGLTCSCLPTLRPLIVHHMPWISTTADSYKHYRTTGQWSMKRDTEHGRSGVSGNSDDTSHEKAPSRPRTAEDGVKNYSKPLTAAAAPVTAANPPKRTAGVNPTSQMSTASGLFSAPHSFHHQQVRMTRLDSPGDSSDGVAGLYATRAALEEGGLPPPGSPLARAMNPIINEGERPLPTVIQVTNEVHQTRSARGSFEQGRTRSARGSMEQGRTRSARGSTEQIRTSRAGSMDQMRPGPGSRPVSRTGSQRSGRLV